jgi:AraC-like DNA-binding protein
MTVAKPSQERKRKAGRPAMSEMTKDIIVKLYNEDYAIADICDACKISETTLYRILKERREVK